MATWRIEPFIGIGPLKFGTPRDQVRAELGPDFRVFKKGRTSVNNADAYDSLLVHCYYDAQDRLDFIEVGRDSPLSVRFADVEFFDLTLPMVMERMRAHGHPGTVVPEPCHFEGLGVALYVPHSEEIAGISVFSRERFERFLSVMREVAERERLRALKRQQDGPPKNPFK